MVTAVTLPGSFETRRYKNNYGLIAELRNSAGTLEMRMAYRVNDLDYRVWRWCPDAPECLRDGSWKDHLA
jgi:hypothetical protein